MTSVVSVLAMLLSALCLLAFAVEAVDPIELLVAELRERFIFI